MRFFKGIQQLPEKLSGSVLTVGNFDGVHRGHQELIAQLLMASRRYQVDPVALTFNPHPSRILTPDRSVARLFDFADQRERLELLGLKVLVEEPFTPELAKIPADEFWSDWILGPLSPKAIVVGHDFAFGRDREGNRDFLRDVCASRGIEMLPVSAVTVDGILVSSSRIRAALTDGDVEVATRLLGRPFYVKGEVRVGERRGRQLGVPTANQAPVTEFTPKRGVYVTKTHVGSQTFRSITNLGINPTFHTDPSSPIKVETHLFDFAGDLYGREIRVELLKFLREEKRFSGIEELKTQIHRDMALALEYFHDHG